MALRRSVHHELGRTEAPCRCSTAPPEQQFVAVDVQRYRDLDWRPRLDILSVCRQEGQRFTVPT